jgi:hypothetical protein
MLICQMDRDSMGDQTSNISKWVFLQQVMDMGWDKWQNLTRCHVEWDIPSQVKQ